MKILDAGAGIGRWTKQLVNQFPNDEIIALDHKRRLPKIKKVKFVKGSIEKIPLPNDHFDVVIISRVLPYVDMKKAIKEIDRVTKEDGLIVYELMQVGYYLNKLLKGNCKRILNFINWWFYSIFESKLFKKCDNIDSWIMIRYYSKNNIIELYPLKYWKCFPVYSLLFMNNEGKIYKKTLHNKINKIAKKILNEET